MKIEPVDSHAKALTTPFRRPTADATLPWYIDAPQTFYALYLVRVVGREGDTLAFHFLNFRDGQDVSGGPHRLDLNDARIVWRKLPSTIEGATPPNDCGFLFFQEDELTRLSTEGSPGQVALAKAAAAARKSRVESGALVDTGKYPRSASEEGVGPAEEVDELRRIVDQLRRRLAFLSPIVPDEVDALLARVTDLISPPRAGGEGGRDRHGQL
jgi:hypothetical protein